MIYLAVAPKMQHHGLAEKLMDEVIDYADRHKLMISLETHNPANVSMYEKFGFIDKGIAQSTWGGEEWHEMSVKNQN